MFVGLTDSLSLLIAITLTMKSCELCGKGSQMGGKRVKLRGNYNPTQWKRKYPNLQKAKTLEGKRVLACTDCIKKMNKPL